MVESEEVVEKLRSLGLETDISLIESSLVSNLQGGSNQMFKQFKEILEFFNDDKNTFKLGRVKKNVVFPATVVATCREHGSILEESNAKQIKPRYVFLDRFFKNWNIACSSMDDKQGNKSNQFIDLGQAFINFESALEYQKARSGFQDDMEGKPSDKLKSGVLKR
jgi:hypothetical protein